MCYIIDLINENLKFRSKHTSDVKHQASEGEKNMKFFMEFLPLVDAWLYIEHTHLEQ